MTFLAGLRGRLLSEVSQLDHKVIKMIDQIKREIPGQARNEEAEGSVLRQAQHPSQQPALRLLRQAQ